MTVGNSRSCPMKTLALLLALAGAVPAASPELDKARKLYNSTDFDGSLKVLLAIQPKDGAVWELIGRNHYMNGDHKKATEAMEKAEAAEPNNAEYALWLGRAYGRRAETSSPFSAPGYASKARQYFERSVRLNPSNLDAESDLFEFYLEAPGILGGGLDKAEATAEQISRISPAEGYSAMAKLAEKRKEFGRAEEQLRRAIDLAPRQVGRFIDLARFLVKQGRFQEADQNFARAEAIAPDSLKLIYARAEIYVKSKHRLDVAKDLLQRYMSANLTPEDPPRSEAAKLLRQAQGG